MWGPDLLNTIMYFFALSYLAWMVLLVPLLIAGFIHLLRRTARARWGWAAAWVLASALAMTLEVLYVNDYADPLVAPTYTGPAAVSWVRLVEAVGFLTTGAEMLGALIGADRSERQASGRGSHAQGPITRSNRGPAGAR
jgi:hypothetical protein